jgi:hypothetical protein
MEFEAQLQLLLISELFIGLRNNFKIIKESSRMSLSDFKAFLTRRSVF